MVANITKYGKYTYLQFPQMQNLFHGPCGNNESYLIKPKGHKTKLSKFQKQNKKALMK